MNFDKLISQRRSVYNLGAKLKISSDEITKLCSLALKHCPTAFNSQSGCIIILFNSGHKKLWQETANILQRITPKKVFVQTQKKISSFAAAAGTILFFEDEEKIIDLQQKYPLYANKFCTWAEQSQGMLQYITWCLLAEHKIGASLQHYNPLIDDFVKKTFNTPPTWRLCAQMPFGSINKPADPKSFSPIESRLKIFDTD